MTSTSIRELVNLDVETSSICGWLGGGNIKLETNVENEGDVVYYCEIHPNALEDNRNLLSVFNDISKKTCKLWGKNAKNIEIFEDKNEGNLSGYSLSITLANQE